jgi:ribonuclease H / adenosylcobalamin/alpha-ribazole phosphatase
MSRDLIVEADGGSRGNPGPAAYGAIVRDAHSGAVLAELGASLGVATNNVAEYQGAIAGLLHAASIDPEACVEVRLDSKLVVEQMSGRWQIKHPDMKDMARQARNILPPGQVSYSWVPRAENAAADALVNEALDSYDGITPVVIARFPSGSGVETPRVDLLGSVQELHARDVASAAAGGQPNVMIGWSELGSPVVTHMARHGSSAYSLEKRFSGAGGRDVPLAPLGVEQANALAREIVERDVITRIISSPLKRARETALIVAQQKGLEVEVIDDFIECSFGEWDGYTYAEVKERWPDALEEWLAGTHVGPPGGESFEQVQERVTRGLSTVINAFPGEQVLIVSHVTPIKILTSRAIGAPLNSLFRMELPPCSLSTQAWFPDGNSSMFSFAEAGHLQGMKASGI